jgi:hypothetical protein
MRARLPDKFKPQPFQRAADLIPREISWKLHAACGDNTGS